MGSSSQNTTQNQQSNITQTPINPDWVTSSLKNYTDQVNANAAVNPLTYVPNATADQQMAFDSAPTTLNAYQPAMDAAAATGATISTNPAALINSTATYNPASSIPTSTFGATNAGATGYNAATIDPNSLGVGGTTVGAQATAANQSLPQVDLSQYMSPYLNSVVGSYLDNFNQFAGQTRAQDELAAANSGAINSARYGLQQGQTTQGLGLDLNSGLSNLLNTGYTNATQNAQQDLTRATANNQFNAGQINTGSLTQAQLNAVAAQQTAALQAQAAQSNQSALNQAGQFGAGALNTAALQNSNLGTQASGANAAAANANALAAFNAQNQAGLTNAAAANQTALANQASMNTNTGLQLNAGQLLNSAGANQAAAGVNSLNTLAALGGQQYQINQAQAQAPLALAGITGSQLGQGQFGLLQGQNQVGTASGTSTTTNNPSILQDIGSVAGDMSTLGGSPLSFLGVKN